MVYPIPTWATLMVFLSSCRQEVQVQFSPEAQVSEMLCCTALGGKAASVCPACCSWCQLLSLCSSPCRAPGDEEAQGENLITSNGKAALCCVCSGQENALAQALQTILPFSLQQRERKKQRTEAEPCGESQHRYWEGREGGLGLHTGAAVGPLL